MADTRSIPACAGEPMAPFCPACRQAVYPRVCGGTAWQTVQKHWMMGLSPRVRGNPLLKMRRRRKARSIPACAGEPAARALSPGQPRVYPRVCGGTGRRQWLLLAWTGLSPRVRGNPVISTPSTRQLGSIPACAGEPPHPARQHRPPKVYPRVCGGTQLSAATADGSNGLSPRVRGNQYHAIRLLPVRRSIPACAGEPCRPKRIPWQ